MNHLRSRKPRIAPILGNARALTVAVLLLAFFLRVRTLDLRALWFDEALEYWVAVAPFWDVHKAATELTFDPPLYSYVLHVWKQIGHQEFWLRLPSVFFSLLGLSALLRLGKLSLSWTGGLFVGLLVACSAADVRYAQEVGQYALMIALLSLNLVFLFAARHKSSLTVWILWGMTSVLSIYSHYGAVLVIAVTSTIWLLRSLWSRDSRALQHQLIVAGGAIALLAPLLLFIIPAQMNRFAPHLAPFAATEFFQRSNAILLFHFMGNQVLNWIWPTIPRFLVSLPIVLVLLLAFWKVKSLADWPILLTTVWMGYFLLGLKALYVFAGTRHALLLSPLLMLTIGAGLVVLWRWQKAAGLLVLLYLVGLSLFTPLEAQQDLRSVADYWANGRQDDHVTYVYYGAVPAFRYQLLLREDGETSGHVPPDWYHHCWAGQPASYCVEENIYYGRWLREFDATTKAARIFETLGQQPDYLWIIFSHTSEVEAAELLSRLRQDYRVAREHRASHAATFLLERTKDSLSSHN